MKNQRNLVYLLLSFTLCSCFTGTPSSSASSESPASSVDLSSSSSSLDSSLLPKWEEHDCFSYAYSYLGKDVMPIGGWCSPTGNYITNEQYATLKQSGLNSIYGLYETYTNNKADVDKSLSYSKLNGVVYLARDNSLGVLLDEPELLKTRMDYYDAYANCQGLFVADEPGADQFATLGKIVRTMRQKYPSELIYMNAFPIYASANQLQGVASGGTMDYDAYLEKYMTEIQPDVLSYDYYPFDGASPKVTDAYFTQLYKAATVSSRHKVPFWPFIQACQWGGQTRVPTEGELSWSVSTSLVYGAKGLQYFCYFQPTEFDASFGGCYVNKSGQKTDVYGYGKKINEQVARMDGVLMGSTLLAKMAFGSTPCPFDTAEKSSFVTSFRELQSVSTQDDLLVGCFDNGGKSSFLVVNNSTRESGAANLRFTAPIRANVYNKESTLTADGTSLALSLGPGECSLVEITNYR